MKDSEPLNSLHRFITTTFFIYIFGSGFYLERPSLRFVPGVHALSVILQVHGSLQQPVTSI